MYNPLFLDVGRYAFPKHLITQTNPIRVIKLDVQQNNNNNNNRKSSILDSVHILRLSIY